MDMAAGYSPDDWPADYVAIALPRVAESFAGREDAPRCLVWAEGTPDPFRIGPEQGESAAVTIHGQPADVLAWLTGRADGTRPPRRRLRPRRPRSVLGTSTVSMRSIGLASSSSCRTADLQNDATAACLRLRVDGACPAISPRNARTGVAVTL